MTRQELETKVAEIRKYKAMIEEATKIEKELEKAVINHLVENGLTEEVTDSAKITYSERTRTTLDNARLTEIFGADLEPFKKITTYNVLNIR